MMMRTSKHMCARSGRIDTCISVGVVEQQLCVVLQRCIVLRRCVTL